MRQHALSLPCSMAGMAEVIKQSLVCTLQSQYPNSPMQNSRMCCSACAPALLLLAASSNAAVAHVQQHHVAHQRHPQGVLPRHNISTQTSANTARSAKYTPTPNPAAFERSTASNSCG